jgi:hypothetical protein
MHHMRFLLSLLLVIFFSSCVLLPTPEFKPGDKEAKLLEIKKFFDDRIYEGAVQSCQEFLEAFPESPFCEVVLVRLGESFEGLLEINYHQLVKEGVKEEIVRKKFFEKYGHYQCWVEGPRGVHYNLEHYRKMMERFPDGNYADEAAYHLIPWVYEYKGLPEGPLKEMGDLEKVLKDYPTTSLRPKIYYQIAYRLHLLYEIYAFSPQAELRNEEEATKYQEKARYFYKLVLKQPEQSEFSRKAWKDLKKLEEGKRIYITQ